jgi:hypothetical protein
MVADATMLVDAVGRRSLGGPAGHAWPVRRALHGPPGRWRIACGWSMAWPRPRNFTYATIQRGDVAIPFASGSSACPGRTIAVTILRSIAGRALGRSAPRDDRRSNARARARRTRAARRRHVRGRRDHAGFVSSGGDALAFVTERDADAILGWMAPESRRLAGGQRPDVLPSAVVVKLLPGVRGGGRSGGGSRIGRT